MVRQFKIIVEEHPDGYMAFPLGVKRVTVWGRWHRPGPFSRGVAGCPFFERSYHDLPRIFN